MYHRIKGDLKYDKAFGCVKDGNTIFWARIGEGYAHYISLGKGYYIIKKQS
jgi:hypothetical protein